MERVRELVAEYGEGEEGHRRNSNPASLHEFLQRMKVILNAEPELIREDDANLESNRNDNASGGSLFGSSSLLMIDTSNSSSTAKVMEALGNHVVLREIFKCGSSGDLNNFRRFDGQWKMIANSLIIQRRLWKLKFKDTFGGSVKKRNETLLKLNECIEASGGSFPLTTLDLSDVKDYSNLNRAAVLRFYDLMGHSIKRLVLNNFGPLTLNEFQDLLEKKMPNVDHIDAGNIFFSTNNKNQEFSRRLPLPIIDLPNLKTIRFVHDKPTKQFRTLKVLPYYRDLLLAAQNLKEILNFRVQLTDLVIETGKMDCIQKLVINLPVSEACSHLFVKYSCTGPKLTSLSISVAERVTDQELVISLELGESLTRILISSKDTLKHLQWVSNVFPANFQLPKFPNLELLTIVDCKYRYISPSSVPRPIFPLGCDCSETFPNVTTVSLYINDGYCLKQRVVKYFRGQVFPSVKTLQFHNSFHFGRAFKRIFPNVSHIQSRGIYSAQGFDLENQIESLEFDECRLAGYWQGFQLDCLFTGAPKDVCKNLLGMYNERKARGNDGQDIAMVKNILQAVQTHYMFRNSKGLRLLKINFNHKDNVDFNQHSMNRMPEPEPETSGSDEDKDDGDLESVESEDENENRSSTQEPVITAVSCVYGFYFPLCPI